MKHILLFVVAILVVATGNAQHTGSKLDLRIGAGSSLLGTGDMQTIMIENELNVNVNTYFALGGGLAYARSNNGVSEQASFIQLNANVYFSPLRNNRKYDLRLGTGLSWYTVSDVYQSSVTYENGQVIDYDYELSERTSIGLNVIIENTYAITEKYMLGLKLFTQPYRNGDINSGVLLKLGVNI